MKVHFETLMEVPSYETLFLQRYEKIQRWALSIAKNDRELAEDIVHDLYVRFTLTRRIPPAVENVDNYVYVALKNHYRSVLRRTIKARTTQLSHVEQEISNDVALSFDPRQINKIHDQLRAICYYSCVRKSTSIGASILILRFFHGYLPSEVALILRRSLNAIEWRLKAARLEAASFLKSPEKLAALTKKTNCFVNGAKSVGSSQNIFNELRQKVFSTKQGNCLSIDEIKDFYAGGQGNLPRSTLSHLVSCEICLRNCNLMLDLPQLSERHPVDILGRETGANVPVESDDSVKNQSLFAASSS